jgi:hypothetical protein
MAGQTRSPQHDDPIRRLRETYTEQFRIYERRDRIEACVLFIFLWFFSFWSTGLLLVLFGDCMPSFSSAGRPPAVYS